MQVELDVRMFPNGAALTVADVAARLPTLGITVAPAIERVLPEFHGRIQVDGDDDEVRRTVATHLVALRAFSTEFPTVTIAVCALDGGELRLEAGSFGADEQELASLLAEIAGDDVWRVMVSFRIEASAQAHLRDLVARAVPASWEPIVDEAPNALAMGFAISGDRHRVANMIACLRLAWRQEGSEAECLLEIEGSEPVLTVLRTWADWVDVERTLRRGPTQQRKYGSSVTAPSSEVTALADVPEAMVVLAGHHLSWIDADDQILCLSGGVLYALPERVEAGHFGQIRRRGDGSLLYVDGDRRVEIPTADDDIERRLHGVGVRGALFSDTCGSVESARTRLFLVDDNRVDDGPELTCVRALELDNGHAFGLAGPPDRLRLIAFDLAGGWGYAEECPWRPDEVAMDLAVVSASRIAIVVQRGQRSALYLVERANLAYARTIALPCVAPQIAGCAEQTLWVTGMSPSPGPTRTDVFRIGLTTGKVVVETAELDSPAHDVVVDESGTEAVFSTRRGVYVTGTGAPRELVELHARDEVVGLAYRGCPAVFVRGPASSRVVLGHDRVSIALRSPAFAPRFLPDSPVAHR